MLSQLCAKSGWADEDSKYESHHKLLIAILLAPIYQANTRNGIEAQPTSSSSTNHACGMLPGLPALVLGSGMRFEHENPLAKLFLHNQILPILTAEKHFALILRAIKVQYGHPLLGCRSFGLFEGLGMCLE